MILRDHEAWLAGDTVVGIRAELAGADLRTAPLRHANLRRANLAGANLSGADLTGTCLCETDLRSANLTDAIGLSSEHVAGANLAGAKLSGTIAGFDGLAQVQEVSKSTARTFVLLVSACLYSWLTIATTTDAKLLTSFVSSPLPVIQTAIPLYLFYRIAPLILFALYLYLHLQLQDLWQAVTELPAFFPDGRSIGQRIHPWLLTALVRSLIDRKSERSLTAFLQIAISWLLAWWLVPITFVVFWLRHLPRHDWIGSAVQLGVLGLATFLAAWSRRRTVEILRRRGRSSSVVFPCTIAAIAMLGGLLVSYGAIDGIKEEAETLRNPAAAPTHRFSATYWLRIAVPKALSAMRQRAFADMMDQVVSQRPGNGSSAPAPLVVSPLGARRLERETLPDDQVRGVVGAGLHDKDLAYANAKGAFLVRADLSNTNFRGADLSHASLQRADLENAHLAMAYLSSARLENADMKAADLTNAYLGDTWMEGADLRGAQLSGVILLDSDLHGAELSFAQFRGAMLSRTNLDGASMFGTDLRGANLQFARNLTQDQIAQAFTDCSTILPGNLQRPSRCPPAPAPPACESAGGAPPEMRDGAHVITLASGARTCAALIGEPGELERKLVLVLDQPPAHDEHPSFGRATVGSFYTLTPIPPGAPDGTQVVNLPPGDGRSGYFRVTFIAPRRYSSVRLVGRANVDDTGRVFLNGSPISTSIFSPEALSEFGNVAVSTSDPALFRRGAVNEIVVSDLNTGGGPSGAAFYFTITFRE